MLSMWIMLIMWSISGVIAAGVPRAPCMSPWKYHEVSRSCLLLVHVARNYYQSHLHCIQLGARLVFILDKQTDDFVKDLLLVEDVHTAWIGLHDRVRKGEYMWGDTRMRLSGYAGWESNERQPDWNRDLSSVVISRGGWWEYNRHLEVSSVCQYGLGVPEKPKCVHTFVGTEIEVKCVAAEFFSEVLCELETYRENEYMGKTVGRTWTVETSTQDGQPGVNVTGCSVSFSPGGPGVFTLTVVLTFTLWASRGIPNTAQSLTVEIIPPEDPPRLYESTSNSSESPTQLQITDNTSVSLTCQVPGGTPAVYRTQIDCGNSTHQETPLAEVELVLQMTSYLHGRTCTCRAFHLAGYNLTASLVLLVADTTNDDTKYISVQEIQADVENTTRSLNTSNEWSETAEQIPTRNTSSASVNLNLRTLVTLVTVGQIWFVMIVLVVTVFTYYRYNIRRRTVTLKTSFKHETQETQSFCPGYKSQVDGVSYENIEITGDSLSYEAIIKPCSSQTTEKTSDSCDRRKQAIGQFYENVLLIGDSPNMETAVTENTQERQEELAVLGGQLTDVTGTFYENVWSINNTDVLAQTQEPIHTYQDPAMLIDNTIYQNVAHDDSENPISPPCTCMCHGSADLLDNSVPEEVVYFNTNIPETAVTASTQERQEELTVLGGQLTEVTCTFYENVWSIHNKDNSNNPISPPCTCICHGPADLLDNSVPEEVVYFNTNIQGLMS